MHLRNIQHILECPLIKILVLDSRRRNRRIEPGNSPYAVDLDSARLENGVLNLNVLNTRTGILLKLELYALQNHMVRMKINEVSPLKPRYEVPDVLVEDPPVGR